jgi:hypothetical protein
LFCYLALMIKTPRLRIREVCRRSGERSRRCVRRLDRRHRKSNLPQPLKPIKAATSRADLLNRRLRRRNPLPRPKSRITPRQSQAQTQPLRTRTRRLRSPLLMPLPLRSRPTMPVHRTPMRLLRSPLKTQQAQRSRFPHPKSGSRTWRSCLSSAGSCNSNKPHNNRNPSIQRRSRPQDRPGRNCRAATGEKCGA